MAASAPVVITPAESADRQLPSTTGPFHSDAFETEGTSPLPAASADSFEIVAAQPLPVASAPVVAPLQQNEPDSEPNVETIERTETTQIGTPAEPIAPTEPVAPQADPITGTPFDELIAAALASPAAPEASAPSAPAKAPTTTPSISTPIAPDTCAGLSELDELTFQLHDGLDVQAGAPGDSTAKLLVNYGRDLDDRSFVRVTDRRNAFSKGGSVYFAGEVQFGETFNVRAEASGTGEFRDRIYLHYFDEENHNLLRSVQYSASCETPAQLNDELSGATLVGFQ
ncbi:MAG: hypothetical protein ACFB9N_10885 [Geitlerinemataceae cyanobacterium]